MNVETHCCFSFLLLKLNRGRIEAQGLSCECPAQTAVHEARGHGEERNGLQSAAESEVIVSGIGLTGGRRRDRRVQRDYCEPRARKSISAGELLQEVYCASHHLSLSLSLESQGDFCSD